MSFPPAFLDELRARLTLSEVAARKVTWDRRRSNAAKGDWWAPCPFHQEKTASFHVDDRKGFYYCFGCHAKGDLISFVRETENLDFVEAVEALAREAGLEIPARGERDGERRDRLARLADVMEEAVRAYGRAFRSATGQAARDYARSRALTDETLKRFEIGFAPDDRQFLAAPFREKGLVEEAIATGLLIRPEDGGAPYDRFRNRLMFPIRDPRGRCIAFGGRAMSPEARAKYLNSPETELFHKGRTLYNHGPAREAAGEFGGVIVAEGYMDVIALAQAGLDHAVAPLGTAVTDEQLALLWRMADEPVIALDGDRAGLDAAARLVDMALPLLAPGRSLGFCLMPDGQDPDDLIRAGGPTAMREALAAAVPLVEMLWRRETARGPLDTPERRAALDARLREALRKITDQGVRNHYAAELRARRAALFRPAGTPRRTGRPQRGPPRPGRGFAPSAPARPAVETLGSDLARASARDAARLRESAILLIALRNPQALPAVEPALEAMTCTTTETERLRGALLDGVHDGAQQGPDDLAGTVLARVGEAAVAAVEKVPQARAHPMARPGLDPAAVALVLDEAIHRHQSLLAQAVELAEARRDLAEAEDERWTARVRHALHERMTADTESVARAAEAAEEGGESVFQRMLDSGAWRRRRQKT
jgi:DNA primase